MSMGLRPLDGTYGVWRWGDAPSSRHLVGWRGRSCDDFGDDAFVLTFRAATAEVVLDSGKVVELTPCEWRLLAALVPAKHTATYDRMCQAVYNEPCDLAYRHCIQIIGSRLRKRCGLTIRVRPCIGFVLETSIEVERDGAGQ